MKFDIGSKLGLILSSLAFYLLFLSLSFFFNLFLFADAHKVVTFFRSDDQFVASPGGLAITTIVWSFLVSLSYALWGNKLNIGKPYKRGFVYGLLVFVFFIWQQELYYYQFVEFPIGILIGAQLHMVTAFSVGCSAIALIQEYFNKKQSQR